MFGVLNIAGGGSGETKRGMGGTIGLLGLGLFVIAVVYHVSESVVGVSFVRIENSSTVVARL